MHLGFYTTQRRAQTRTAYLNRFWTDCPSHASKNRADYQTGDKEYDDHSK